MGPEEDAFCHEAIFFFFKHSVKSSICWYLIPHLQAIPNLFHLESSDFHQPIINKHPLNSILYQQHVHFNLKLKHVGCIFIFLSLNMTKKIFYHMRNRSHDLDTQM